MIKTSLGNIYNPDMRNLKQYGLTENEIIIILKDVRWSNIRCKRDLLIHDTDWTQTIDCPLSVDKKSEFTAYRQALRDIPQTYDNPDDIVWPTKPTI